MNFLALRPLTTEYLADAVNLDRRCLGGLWTADGYQREIESPNSDLLMLHRLAHPLSTHPLAASPLDASPLDANLPEPHPGEDAATLIGLACSWAILDEAHITLLAIDPTYRRQGLGSLLLYALLYQAHQRGLEWATLEVRASNQSALALYEQFGFESVGTRPKYYPDGEDALILWRKGLQRPDFRQVLEQWRCRLGDRFDQHWRLEQGIAVDIAV